MPILKSGKKAMTRDAGRRAVNDRRRRGLREQMKSLKKFITAKDTKGAQELMPKIYQMIDKAIKAGVIKKNTGARKKSQASRMVKEM
jgi:small subunit ribosomal protein S20